MIEIGKLPLKSMLRLYAWDEAATTIKWHKYGRDKSEGPLTVALDLSTRVEQELIRGPRVWKLDNFVGESVTTWHTDSATYGCPALLMWTNCDPTLIKGEHTEPAPLKECVLTLVNNETEQHMQPPLLTPEKRYFVRLMLTERPNAEGLQRLRDRVAALRFG